MSTPPVVIAYWVPMYVTVETERGEVVGARVAMKGMRRGSPVTGEVRPAPTGEAARIVAEAVTNQCMPELEVS